MIASTEDQVVIDKILNLLQAKGARNPHQTCCLNQAGRSGRRWGRADSAGNPLKNGLDKQIAATALIYDLTVLMGKGVTDILPILEQWRDE